MLHDLTRFAKRYSTIILLIFFSLLTLAALVRLSDLDLSWETLRQVEWRWYALVFGLFYLSVIARGLRWRRILHNLGYPVRRLYAVTLLTAGLFGSAILPARAGDVGRIAMLKQDYNVPIAHSLASIATERAMDVLAILSLAIIGGVIALREQIPLEAAQLMGLTALLFTLGLTGLIVTPYFEQWLREPIWLRRNLPLPQIVWTIYEKLLDFGFSLVHGVRRLGQSPLTLLLVLAESFVIWLYDVLILYFSLWAIGVSLDLPAAMFVSMVADLAIAIPITPGGLGQFEAALIALLTIFGVSTSEGALTALLIRFAIFWTWIPISGLITYAFGFARLMDWRNVAKT